MDLGRRLTRQEADTALLGLDAEPVLGLSFSRTGRGEILDLIVKAARAADLVLRWPSTAPTFALTSASQSEHLPQSEWRTVVVPAGVISRS